MEVEEFGRAVECGAHKYKTGSRSLRMKWIYGVNMDSRLAVKIGKIARRRAEFGLEGRTRDSARHRRGVKRGRGRRSTVAQHCLSRTIPSTCLSTLCTVPMYECELPIVLYRDAVMVPWVRAWGEHFSRCLVLGVRCVVWGCSNHIPAPLISVRVETASLEGCKSKPKLCSNTVRERNNIKLASRTSTSPSVFEAAFVLRKRRGRGGETGQAGTRRHRSSARLCRMFLAVAHALPPTSH